MAASICDSIQQLNDLDPGEVKREQRRIYHDELTRYPTLLVDITGLNRPREFNEYNYRINRELLRTCEGYEDQFSMLPLSKILDLEGLFSESEYDSLEGLIIQFIHLKKTDLVVVTLDDPYPFQDFASFVQNKGEVWNIGGHYEKGGLMLVYSSVLKGFTAFTGNLTVENPSKTIFQYQQGRSGFEQLSQAIVQLLQE